MACPRLTMLLAKTSKVLHSNRNRGIRTPKVADVAAHDKRNARQHPNRVVIVGAGFRRAGRRCTGLAWGGRRCRFHAGRPPSKPSICSGPADVIRSPPGARDLGDRMADPICCAGGRGHTLLARDHVDTPRRVGAARMAATTLPTTRWLLANGDRPRLFRPHGTNGNAVRARDWKTLEERHTLRGAF